MLLEKSRRRILHVAMKIPLNIQAAKKKNWPEWKEALQTEWNQQVLNNTFELISSQSVRSPLMLIYYLQNGYLKERY